MLFDRKNFLNRFPISFLIFFGTTLVLNFGIFSDPNERSYYEFSALVKNNTTYPFRAPKVEILTSASKYFAILGGTERIPYSVFGESLVFSKENGDIAVILTNKNLLAIGTNSSNWVREPLYGDYSIKVQTGTRMAFVRTNKKYFYFSANRDSWAKSSLDNETILAMDSLESLGVIITDKKIRSFLESEELPYEMNLINLRISSFTIFLDKIVFETTANKSIIFNATKKEYTIFSMN